VVTDK